eukprot:gene2357-2716_t
MNVSQATALELSDANINDAVNGDAKLLQHTVQPANDGTNACAFLCLGIIDRLMHYTSTELETLDSLEKHTSKIITDFPIELNEYRDTSTMYDIHQAAAILSSISLLSHKLSFEEKVYDNKKVYSYDFQVKAQEVLKELSKYVCNGKTSIGVCNCSGRQISFHRGSNSSR